MVATISQAFRPEFYLKRQRSYRHPNEYYRSGEEADGVWWNPLWLFGLEDGARIDSRDFFRLHGGVAPDGSARITHNSCSGKRSAGVDLAFNVDKSVSALWAIADAGPQADIRMEQYGPATAFTRIVDMPEELVAHWSKRRATISKAAGPGAFYELGPGNKPARGLDRLLRTLAGGDTGVRLSDIVQQVENMTAGLFDRPAVARRLERLLDKSRIVSPGRVELGNERRAWQGPW